METPQEPATVESTDLHFPRIILSQRVKEYIVEAILKGEYHPGERIMETSLARRFGISTAPVREAIRELVVMGFLEAQPYKGASVRSFSTQDLWEYYTVRAALESLAARQAAARLTDAEASQLQGILDDMLRAVEDKDMAQTIRLDNKFHETILQIAGNTLLHQVWKTLEFGVWTMVVYRMGQYDATYLATRHKEVLEALKTRNPEAASLAMQHHLEDLGTPPQNPQPMVGKN
jgi:DNA-binding GntR family transcriptional regulator